MSKHEDLSVCDLADRRCEPCRGGVPPLTEGEQAELIKNLDERWRVVDGHHLACEFAFSDFVQALAFTNAVGALAEENGHHPDLALSWGKLGVQLHTHAIDGLTEADFILAAKIDRAGARAS